MFLKMCNFLNNILKIAVSVRQYAFIYQISAFVILLCCNFTLLLSNFCWLGCKVWLCLPAQGTLATLLIHSRAST